MTRRLRRSRKADLDRLDLTDLALRAADGDVGSEHAFVRRTMDDVWRFCAHTLGAEAADDALQATYIRALASLHRFRGDSSAKTWLIGVARNTCYDEMRSRGRRDRILTKVANQPLDTTAEPEATVDYDDALGCLAAERREAFVLTQVLGFTYEEAAEVQGCATGTVRSRVARARAELVGALTEEAPLQIPR